MPHVELPQADFKVVMLGETFTGKTSLVLRFAEGYYRDSARNPTVGAFFITKRLTVNMHQRQLRRQQQQQQQQDDENDENDEPVPITAKLQIWDTAGQEHFKKLAPMYYKDAAAAIICYDVTSPKSFETLECKFFELFTIQRMHKLQFHCCCFSSVVRKVLLSCLFSFSELTTLTFIPHL
jgi:small GTP-binding protein